MIVLPIAQHYNSDGTAAQRVESRLGSAARYWYRTHTSQARDVRPGMHCLVVDGIDRKLGVYVVTDTARDGRGYVIAYEPLFRNESKSLNATKRRLEALGLTPTTKTFRTQWLDEETSLSVVEALYGPRRRASFLKEWQDSGRFA